MYRLFEEPPCKLRPFGLTNQIYRPDSKSDDKFCCPNTYGLELRFLIKSAYF